MKVLSVTQQGGRVVELTRDEWLEFQILAKAVEGVDENEAKYSFATRDAMYAVDSEMFLEGVFGAILAFYSAKFKANELKHLAESLENALKKG